MSTTEDAVLQLFVDLHGEGCGVHQPSLGGPSPSDFATPLPISDDKKANVHELKYSQFLEPRKLEASLQFKNDGSPCVFACRGSNGVREIMYRWSDKIVDAHEDLENTQRTQLLTESIMLTKSVGKSATQEGSPALRDLGILTHGHHAVCWSKYKGVVVLVHGITSHSRYEWLKLETVADSGVSLKSERPLDISEQERLLSLVQTRGIEYSYEGSWVARFNLEGYVVYAIENQGHGLSDAWGNSRCNVKQFQDYENDVFHWLDVLRLSGEVPLDKEIYLGGLSLGGLILSRVITQGYKLGRIVSPGPADAEGENVKPGTGPGTSPSPTNPIPFALPVPIKGVFLLAPAVSGEQLRSKTSNKILAPFGSCVSQLAPHAKLVKLARNDLYPFLQVAMEKDVLVYHQNLPARIADSSYKAMDTVIPGANAVSSDLRLFIAHSQKDTMTDFHGSEKFYQSVSCKNKKMVVLNHPWHFLTKEPGNEDLLDEICLWMKQA